MECHHPQNTMPEEAGRKVIEDTERTDDRVKTTTGTGEATDSMKAITGTVLNETTGGSSIKITETSMTEDDGIDLPAIMIAVTAITMKKIEVMGIDPDPTHPNGVVGGATTTIAITATAANTVVAAVASKKMTTEGVVANEAVADADAAETGVQAQVVQVVVAKVEKTQGREAAAKGHRGNEAG